MDVMDARPASSTQDIRQNPAGGPLFPPAGAAKGPTEHSWQTVWPYCEATTGEDDPTDICGDPLLDTFEAVSWQAATPSEIRVAWHTSDMVQHGRKPELPMIGASARFFAIEHAASDLRLKIS